MMKMAYRYAFSVEKAERRKNTGVERRDGEGQREMGNREKGARFDVRARQKIGASCLMPDPSRSFSSDSVPSVRSTDRDRSELQEYP